MIVRVRDEAEALDRCLTLIDYQQGLGAAPELIVVDNDSQDTSAAVARRHGAQVVRISRPRFTFGRALNLGASVAHGSVLVALSAHAYVHDTGWLARIAAWLDDPRIACASGERYWPDASPLLAPVSYDAFLARGYPRWGYSNVAGAFRAALWRERHFREDLPGAEDKEWGRYWALADRGVTLLDPGLVVDHDHSRDRVAEVFTRAHREAAGMAMYLNGAAPRTPLLREWFDDPRLYANPWRARFSPRRTAWLLGERLGAATAQLSSRAGR